MDVVAKKRFTVPYSKYFEKLSPATKKYRLLYCVDPPGCLRQICEYQKIHDVKRIPSVVRSEWLNLYIVIAERLHKTYDHILLWVWVIGIRGSSAWGLID